MRASLGGAVIAVARHGRQPNPSRAARTGRASALATGLLALFSLTAPAQPIELSEDRPATHRQAIDEASRFARSAGFEAPIATPTRAWMTRDGTIVAAGVGSLAYYNTPRDEQYLERLLREKTRIAALRMILVSRYEGVDDPEALWTGLALREGGVRLRGTLPRLGGFEADRNERRLWIIYTARADDPAFARPGAAEAWGLPDLSPEEVREYQAWGWLTRSREHAAAGRHGSAFALFMRAARILDLPRRDLLQTGYASAMEVARVEAARGEDPAATLQDALWLLRAAAQAETRPARTITIDADARIAERIGRALGALGIEHGREEIPGNGLIRAEFRGTDAELVEFLARLDRVERGLGHDRPAWRHAHPAEGLIVIMPLPPTGEGAHDLEEDADAPGVPGRDG